MTPGAKFMLWALCALSLFGFAYYFQWMNLTPGHLPMFDSFNVFRHKSDSRAIDNSTHSWDVAHQTEISNTSASELTDCPETPPDLAGPLNIDLTLRITMDDVIDEYKNMEEGGHFKPDNCRALHRTAIIIPFRNRDKHLVFWLHYMHNILMRQQADYGVYVIEQIGDTTFNRAKLMNVGFTEAQKEYDYNCFIFSDIDIIPMNDRNLYRCGNNPRHMANAVDKFGFRLLYDTLFGGVVAFTKDQFFKVNGFSNMFWGWGGEDDELYRRVVAQGMRIERPDSFIARSKMIGHNRDPGNESNGKSFHLIDAAGKRMHQDGLTTLQYQVINRTKHKLYTKISVDVGKPEF